MRAGAAERGWDDAEALLADMAAEAAAEAHAAARQKGGAFLFYHLGEVQRALAAAQPPLRQPPLSALLPLLRSEGFAASQSHSEAKALKTSATLDDVVRVVREYQRQQDAEEGTRQEELEVE